MKRTILAVLAALILALTACDTQPATDITSDAATLNAQGGCEPGWHAGWWYEIRRISPSPTSWTNVGNGWHLDCTFQAAVGPITPIRATGLSANSEYQFRIALAVDGGYPVQVVDSNGKTAERGSVAANSLNYDQFVTDDVGGGPIGHDYTEGAAQPSVSAPRTCEWKTRLERGTLVGDGTWGSVLVECNNTPDIRATCKVELRVYSSWTNDSEYGPQDCHAVAALFKTAFTRDAAGARFDFYIRLNDSHKRWTQSYVFEGERPNRGCELYFTSESQHVLHCTDVRGNYYPEGG